VALQDLQKWDYVGLVWSFVKDATWEKGARYVWAPEIHYVRGNYYFAYCVSGGQGGGTGILKSSTGKPEGPYVYALASGMRASAAGLTPRCLRMTTARFISRAAARVRSGKCCRT
jgi:hypothetical protein